MPFQIPSATEFDFRDGRRSVPEHLVPLMRRIETFRLVYAEAVSECNRLMQSDVINAEQDRILAAHFRLGR